ncbi:MAG: transposase [Coriobacteriales bacterium]|jgi:transposase|nr:transposase [Coriobacteriales bacterium]
MSLSERVKVPMPESGVTTRRSGGRSYVYKVTRSYRNGKGQPTSDRVSIGRLDAATGMLVPNDNYWVLYEGAGVEILPSYDSVRSVGATFLVGGILEGLGAGRMLQAVLGPERASLALTAATYMTCRGNVMEHILGWCESHTLCEAALDDRMASALFSSITFGERMAFFRAWVAAHGEDGYLAYDVTSFSSYAKGIQGTEWGHNRDGERLPQINMGCYMGFRSALPLFYVTYPGSIVDKSHMAYMMAYNADLGIHGATFVVDRGFCTTANVRYLHGEGMPYILGVEVRHKATKAAIDKVADGMASMRRRICQGIYAECVRGFFYGEQANMHIYLDPALAEAQRSDLYRTVEAQEERLAQMGQQTKKEAKRLSAFFDIGLGEGGTFTFKRSYSRIDEAARHAGYFCLLTSTDLSSAEALGIYRRRDVIEKCFDDLKNHVDMKRLRTHSTETADGKLFCAFLALIAACQVNAKLGKAMKDMAMSKDSVIAEMDKIKAVYASGGRRLMNPVTKTQRLILEAFGLGEGDVKSYVASKPA